jgi:hypothetical protein
MDSSSKNLMKVAFNAKYGLGETISTKGDVYIYGILLLEMHTRKQPTSDMFGGDLTLHKWVNLLFPNRVNEVIDNNIFTEMDGDEFEKYIVYKCLLSLLNVGFLCSKDSPEERPTMKDVVILLVSAREKCVGSRRLRLSISYFLNNTNATRNDASTSHDKSSSSFRL